MAGGQPHARNYTRLADGEGKHTKSEAIGQSFAGRIMRGLKGRAEANNKLRYFFRKRQFADLPYFILSLSMCSVSVSSPSLLVPFKDYSCKPINIAYG